jgi:subtilisin family serine protease
VDAVRSKGGAAGCRVVVLDTGLADTAFCPHFDAPFTPTTLEADDCDLPDAGADGLIDPVAGHGTFIAGLIGRLAPGAEVVVAQVLSTFGVGDDFAIAEVIAALDPRPDILNCSFGAYTADDEPPLAMTDEIAALVAAGSVVVASAGNDASCRPSWPAALPDVVSVGALAPFGIAPFSNYGPWVRACAPGFGVVSRFFCKADDDLVKEYGEGWAAWSGTSFSAPIVAGVLARAVTVDGLSPVQAVARHIDDPHLLRLNGLGTVINEH